MKHFEDFNREAQQYDKILKRYKEKGEIFTDPNFHPNCSIKEPKVTFNEKETIWERIDKYYCAPLFKKEAISENAIQQGELGTCYFIASLSRIARQPELVELLFDTRTRSKKKRSGKDDFFDTINLKCGAVIVYFHVFGRLTPVLIDTLIPFKRGTRKPKFCHPADIKYSPWFCLVEKAFAKLNGSYSLISGGTLSSAIYHLFGYFPCYKKISSILSKREEKLKEKNKLEKSTKPIKFDENEYLFSQLMQWQRENAVLGADIIISDLRNNVTEDDIVDNGLVTNHAYLIMKVRREQNKNFICLRNPWGDHEWLGDWSDTSPLWTPELKKALGVHSKDDGTFWMIDKDFFKYFSSFDVAKPVNPEYHTKSFMTKLVPGDSDGYELECQESHLERHQTFAFKLKNVRVKSDKDENESKTNDNQSAKKSKIKTVDDVKVYIRIEKRSPLYDSTTDTLYEKPEYAMYVVYSDGKKLEYDRLKFYNRYWLTTSNQFFRSTIHVKENKPFVIVFHRLNKWEFTEECYVQVSCKYDFDLYDVDHPDRPFEEDEKFGIVFNNKSKRYSNISKDLRIKEIDGKSIQAFATLNTNDYSETFYKHLKYNIDEDGSSSIYEYHISGESESEDEKKSPKKKSNSNKDSQKEMKKIIQEKKKVEQMEKKIQEEKKKLDREKKLMMKKKEEIQKENERLEKEKKKLEEEKKKSSKSKPSNSKASSKRKDNSDENNEDESDVSDSKSFQDSEDYSSKDSKQSKSKRINSRRQTKSESYSTNSSDGNSQRNLRKTNSKRKSIEISESNLDSPESKDSADHSSENRTKKRINTKNSRRKVEISSESSDVNSSDMKQRLVKRNSHNNLLRTNKKKIIENTDSEDSRKEPSKSRKQKRLRRLNSQNNFNHSNTRKRIVLTDSDDSDSSQTRSKTSPKRMKLKRKEESVSYSSDSEPENKKYTRKANSNIKNANDSYDSGSIDTERKSPKRNSQNISRRITDDDNSSSSESKSRRIIKRRNSQNNFKRLNSRRKDRDSDSNSDSGINKNKSPKRKSLTNLKQKNSKRNKSDSSYEADNINLQIEIDDSSSSPKRSRSNRTRNNLHRRNQRDISDSSSKINKKGRRKIYITDSDSDDESQNIRRKISNKDDDESDSSSKIRRKMRNKRRIALTSSSD